MTMQNKTDLKLPYDYREETKKRAKLYFDQNPAIHKGILQILHECSPERINDVLYIFIHEPKIVGTYTKPILRDKLFIQNALLPYHQEIAEIDMDHGFVDGNGNPLEPQRTKTKRLLKEKEKNPAYFYDVQLRKYFAMEVLYDVIVHKK